MQQARKGLPKERIRGRLHLHLLRLVAPLLGLQIHCGQAQAGFPTLSRSGNHDVIFIEK